MRHGEGSRGGGGGFIVRLRCWRHLIAVAVIELLLWMLLVKHESRLNGKVTGEATVLDRCRRSCCPRRGRRLLYLGHGNYVA